MADKNKSVDSRVRPDRQESNDGPLLKPSCEVTPRDRHFLSAILNLKSASFVVIMLLHEGLTHIYSQIKPRLLFGESLTLRKESIDTVPLFFFQWLSSSTGSASSSRSV